KYNDLLEMNDNSSVEEYTAFINEVKKQSPCLLSNSVMNKICWKFENAFDKVKLNKSDIKFDYNILKTNKKYTLSDYKEIKEIMNTYKLKVKAYLQTNKHKSNTDDKDIARQRDIFKSEFIESSYKICNDAEKLCNIIIDISYEENGSRSFMWDVVGSQIIQNLLHKNNGEISYPVRDEKGEIEYGGIRFTIKEQLIEGLRKGD